MSDSHFCCNLCVYSTKAFEAFRHHYVRCHKHDPKFYVACCIGACSYTTNKWGNFKVHMHRKHKETITSVNHVSDDEIRTENCDSLSGIEGDQLRATVGDDPVNFNSYFTLSLEAKHNLSQVGIDNIVSSVSDLVESHINGFKRQIKSKLTDIGINPDFVDDIATETHLNVFETHKKRHTFYRQNLETYLHPEEIVMGTTFITKNGTIQEKPALGYIIPFEKSINNLLQIPEVWNYVQNTHLSRDEYLHDVCDGDVMLNHPLFCSNPSALQIAINCDDFEIVNPLGSHIRKHKITVFYFTLLNIPPQYRSKLEAVQLLAICKSKDVRKRQAQEKLLSDFVHTLNRMSSEGISMRLHGRIHSVKGTLVMVSADTLASNWIGGFKEGVSFALKNCRRCEIENAHVGSIFVEREVVMRSEQIHRERCEELENCSASTRKYWSKLWGISKTSCLLKITGFNSISGLVQDPMHVLLEGVVPYELSLVLHQFIHVKHYFGLKWLNTAISSFQYSYIHGKTKPEIIEKQHINDKKRIKQTAAGMLTLVHILPVLIGCKIPRNDAYWMNTLRILQIVLFCTASYCSRDTAFYLRTLIAQYLHNFQTLYSEATIIPKMHFMIHFPSQLLAYGPLRHHWCMRYEGKNGFFANKRYKNFKNLPLSLANRHQIHMAYMQSGSECGRSPNFLYLGDQLGPGCVIDFREVYPDLLEVLENILVSHVHMVYSCQSATIHGLEYRRGCGFVLEYVADMPIFCLLESVVVVDHRKFFVFEKMVSEYDMHIMSYILSKEGTKDIVPHSTLKFKWPLSVYTFNGKSVVMNVNSHTYAYPF